MKFLKNRAQSEMKKNRRKLGVKRPAPAEGAANPMEEEKEAPLGEEPPKRREDKTATKQQKREHKQMLDDESGGEGGNSMQAMGKIFRYRKNMLFDELVKQERHKESMIILQAFRYFTRNGHV